MNKLYFGDNLTVLRDHIKDESVDLIYLDPPFNSNATYNVLFKGKGGQRSEAQTEAFRDTWEWGQSAETAYDELRTEGGPPALALAGLRRWLGDTATMAYVSMMSVRLYEMRRVLKPTGSMYLHCDPTASHYIKVMMDAIFGPSFFQNEIIWKRTGAHGGSKRWGPVHDDILFYTASEDYTWNRVEQALDLDYVDEKYRFNDERGRYRLVVLTGPGTRQGESGKEWRGYNPTGAGRHWAVPKRAVDALAAEGVSVPDGLRDQLEMLYQNNFIRFPNKDGGVPEFKLYLPPGQPIQDIITDIGPINSMAQERLGYPTQKPVALLERILRASSNEGDVVLDPFCGCGTTVEAAERLKRNWVGIDVTHYAITLIEQRLKRHDAQYTVHGRPTDLAGAVDLAARDKHQFQWWASWRLGAQRYREEKKGADRGIDGRTQFKNGPFGDGLIITSVKGGDNLGVAMVRDLRGVIEREGAEMGILITLAEPTKPMVAEAAAAGFVERSAHGRLPRLQIVTVADMLEGRMPTIPALPIEPIVSPRGVREKARDRRQLEFLFPFEGGKQILDNGEFVDPRYLRLG